MSATRPATVPANAIEIPPVEMVPAAPAGAPPYDPQLSAVQQFTRTIAHINALANQVYNGALGDWEANAGQYAALGIPGPAKPVAPALRTANVAWGNAAGVVSQLRVPGDSAWIWES